MCVSATDRQQGSWSTGNNRELSENRMPLFSLRTLTPASPCTVLIATVGNVDVVLGAVGSSRECGSSRGDDIMPVMVPEGPQGAGESQVVISSQQERCS